MLRLITSHSTMTIIGNDIQFFWIFFCKYIHLWLVLQWQVKRQTLKLVWRLHQFLCCQDIMVDLLWSGTLLSSQFSWSIFNLDVSKPPSRRAHAHESCWGNKESLDKLAFAPCLLVCSWYVNFVNNCVSLM